jgi:polyisoprenyl-teichoic acid--peptidoglycan teichoic acid transferase
VPTSRRGRRRRTWPQRLLIGFNICLIFACLVTAAGLGYFYFKFGQLPRIELGNVLTEESGPTAPQNFLVVGVDSAEGIDPADPITIGRDVTGPPRSDTIMVLRVDPGSSKAQLLSILRDLWVPITCNGGEEQRVNTALEYGGAECLVETVERALDIPINHYLQVDWLGFQRIVDAVDGVPIYFPNPVRDRNSGLLIETPGCVTLDPAQALAFARSRYYENFIEGQWQREGSADRGRVQRQQLFIQQALRRAVARGVRNPIVLNQLIDVGLDSVVLDDQLSAKDIFQLGDRFRSFDPATLETYTLPTADEVTAGGAAVQLLLADQAQPTLDVFRGQVDEPGQDLPPAEVRLRVLNGSGVTGQAGQASQDLSGAGFDVVGTGDAEAFGGATTLVRYAPGKQVEADVVRRWLTAGAQVQEAADLAGGDVDVVVVTGADYAGVLAEPVAPEPGDPAATATTAPPASTTAPASTTTVPPEVVPQAPNDAAPCG